MLKNGLLFRLSADNRVVNAGERQIGYQHDLKFNALFGDLYGEIKTSSMHEEWNAIQN